jgi:hypothetical protein
MRAAKRKLAGMRTVRSIAISAAAIVIAVNALMPLRCAEASADNLSRFDVAQTSLGGTDDMQPAPPAPSPPPRAPSRQDRMDYIPPIYDKPQAQPEASPPDSGALWGAIGFTADGSYWSAWKMSSQAEAEALVAKKCSAFGHGGCQVASFSGPQCAGLATFVGNYARRRWQLSFTAGGDTYPEAQRAALARCNSDERTRGNCQSRNVTCADGR